MTLPRIVVVRATFVLLCGIAVVGSTSRALQAEQPAGWQYAHMAELSGGVRAALFATSTGESTSADNMDQLATKLGATGTISSSLRALGKIGASGWELVTIRDEVSPMGKQTIWVFKRLAK